MVSLIVTVLVSAHPLSACVCPGYWSSPQYFPEAALDVGPVTVCDFSFVCGSISLHHQIIVTAFVVVAHSFLHMVSSVRITVMYYGSTAFHLQFAFQIRVQIANACGPNLD